MNVFISYRRTDQWVVDRISASLTRAFGRRAVFRDKEDLELGSPFDDQLDDALGRCDVVLVVIGPGWVSAADPKTGESRLRDPRDLVRREIEAALKRSDVRVIPLFVGLTDETRPRDLPESLAGLLTMHGMTVNPDPYFDEDMRRLIGALRRPGAAPAPGARRFDLSVSFVTRVFSFSVSVMLIGLVFLFYPRSAPDPVAPAPPVPGGDTPGATAADPDATDPVEPDAITNTLGMTLALVPPGRFEMGSDVGNPRNRPAHPVRITRPFYLGIHEVTQAEYGAVMVPPPAGFVPSAFSPEGYRAGEVTGRDTRRFPAEMVRWTHAVDFCNRLSVRENLAPYYRIDAGVTVAGGTGYRLPTEAEWEYARRAGAPARVPPGDHHPARLDEFDWLAGNSDAHTHPVGTKAANALGLFDMGGNVSEWCGDYFDAGFYANSPADDPRNDTPSPFRVSRGASFKTNDPDQAQPWWRDFAQPTDRNDFRGFRVARTKPEP